VITTAGLDLTVTAHPIIADPNLTSDQTSGDDLLELVLMEGPLLVSR
jgi:hypothetical protein